MTGLVAYGGKAEAKAEVLARLRAHAKADEIVQGYGYWADGKGCAIGCLVHSRADDVHAKAARLVGTTEMVARLADCIFEDLPVVDARKWAVAWPAAIQVGADTSRVGWLFLHWLLTDKAVNPGIDHPLVRDAVKQCADVLVPLTKGEPVSRSAAESAAWNAAWNAARGAARSAAWSAESAARGAARSAAWSAESAAGAADAAWSAESAGSAAWNAARNAARGAARGAARSAAYVLMSRKLLVLLRAAR